MNPKPMKTAVLALLVLTGVLAIVPSVSADSGDCGGDPNTVGWCTPCPGSWNAYVLGHRVHVATCV